MVKRETKFKVGDKVRWTKHGIDFEVVDVRVSNQYADKAFGEYVYADDGAQPIWAEEIELLSRPGLTDPHDAEFPEHAKFSAVKDEIEAVNVFLDELQSTGVVLARYHSHSAACRRGEEVNCGMSSTRLYDIMTRRETLISKHFEINERRLAEEKDAMLRQCQARNAKADLEEARNPHG